MSHGDLDDMTDAARSGGPTRPRLGARVLAEALGTGLLVCAVVGSGIAGPAALTRRCRSTAAGERPRHWGRVGRADLGVTARIGRLQPPITVLERATGTIGTRPAVASIAAQLAGGVAGAVLGYLTVRTLYPGPRDKP